MTPRVELVYDRDCPNAEAARKVLREAFARAGLPPSWQEWERGQPDCPPPLRAFTSPTILVDGRDVAGESSRAEGGGCRVYAGRDGRLQGVPAVEAIVQALARAAPTSGPRAGEWAGIAAGSAAGGISLLPVLTCPACWPAYAGLLGSFGVGFLADKAYLLPLTVALLAVALFVLAWRASARRGFGPLFLGAAGAGLLLLGKFVLSFAPFSYGGAAFLVAASLWNAWPRRAAAVKGPCPACAPQGLLGSPAAHGKEGAP